MSAPSDENPWRSVVDLLKEKVPVSKLATAIEKEGVQTYDRFGRRIPVTKKDEKLTVIKDRALDLLANYYALTGLEGLIPVSLDDDNFSDLFDPLQNFGWPKDDLPKFDKMPLEVEPEGIHKSVALDSEPHIRTRHTYQTIIAALCEHSKINYLERGVAVKIAKMTDEIGASVSDDTIRSLLVGISEAVGTRMK